MLDEMLIRINSSEKNINDLIELKNRRELHKACTSFNSQIDKQKKGYEKLKINSKK